MGGIIHPHNPQLLSYLPTSSFGGDITVIEQAKVIARLREYNLELDAQLVEMTQERDNVALERDVAQAEAAEYQAQLDAIREAWEQRR